MSQQFIDADREDKWSASSAERVHYCAGSPALINSIPAEQRQSPATPASKSGDRIHLALETGDASDLDMTEGEITQRLQLLEAEALRQWVEDAPHQPPKTIRESRLWIWNGVDKITSAKVDVAFIHAGCGCVIDFKSGFKATTPAQRNFQAKVQAVALASKYALSSVRVVIAQHRFTSMVTQADYNEEDLQRALQEILTDDWRSKQLDAPRVPGAHCQYCPAKAWCPEAATLALLPVATTQVGFSSITHKLDVSALTVEQLAFIERRRLIAERLFDAVKARLKSLPKEELARVGFELGPGRSQPECKNPNGLCDLLIEMELLKEEEILPMFNFVAGRMEELVLPRYVAKNSVTAEKAKKELRALLGTAGHMDYTSRKTSQILKDIKNV